MVVRLLEVLARQKGVVYEKEASAFADSVQILKHSLVPFPGLILPAALAAVKKAAICAGAEQRAYINVIRVLWG